MLFLVRDLQRQCMFFKVFLQSLKKCLLALYTLQSYAKEAKQLAMFSVLFVVF